MEGPHFDQAKDEEYGKRPAIIFSVCLHLIILFAVVAMSLAGNRKDDDLNNAMVVRLGGPRNMSLGGPKTKAPTAGIKKSKPATRVKETPKKKRPPKKKDAKLGLDRKKTSKKPSQKTTPQPDEKDRAGKSTPATTNPTDEKPNRAKGGLGGQDNGMAVELGDGSEVVDIKDADFITYFKMVQAEIGSRWANHGLSGGSTRIRFFINRNGSVTDVTVAKSSGRPMLDSPARRAVLGSEFPPLPQSYKDDQLIVNISFNYDKK